MVAVRVDMMVRMMLNAVVDIMCSFGVVFFVAGLYWFGRTLIILWQLLYRMIYKAKVEALCLMPRLPRTLVIFGGFKL
jgi:hypothetical protein